MSSWYTPVVSFLESSAKWMEKNPTAASMIGGALAGGAQYYTETKIQKDRESHDKKMYDRRKSDQLDNARASSGIDASGYGNHAKSLVGGTGLLNSAKGGVV